MQRQGIKLDIIIYTGSMRRSLVGAQRHIEPTVIIYTGSMWR